MLAYIVKTGKSAPDFLKPYKPLGYDRGAGMVFHLDLPNAPPLVVPQDPSKIEVIDDNLSCFKMTEQLNLPALLKRTPPIGRAIELGDGQKYHVPQLIVCPNGTSLPRRMKLVSGQVQYEVKPEFIKAWSYGEVIWNMLDMSKPNKLTVAEIWQMYADILSINYIITKWDIAMYSLVCDETRFPFLWECVDYSTFVEMSKADGTEIKK